MLSANNECSILFCLCRVIFGLHIEYVALVSHDVKDFKVYEDHVKIERFTESHNKVKLNEMRFAKHRVMVACVMSVCRYFSPFPCVVFKSLH